MRQFNLQHLKFRLVFNKALRASEASQASKASKDSKDSELARLGDLSEPTALLTYLPLVSQLNKIWSVILQGTLVGHLKLVI